MQECLVFQAYGAPAIIDECKYALLRLMMVYDNNQHKLPHVVIYTDQPQAFDLFAKALKLTAIKITNEQLKAWRGPHDFVHRVKIEVISDCLKRFPGKLVYCDTDTCCTRLLDKLFEAIQPAVVFLYEKEGLINEPSSLHLKKWKKFLQQNTQAAAILKPLPPLQTTMWNAGVIGLETAHASLLEEVLRLTDELYPLFPKHTIEQFSFCYVFQQRQLLIKPAERYFFHYWNLKEFRQLLDAFFEMHQTATLRRLMDAVRSLQPETMLQDKLLFHQKDMLHKWWLKLLKKEWRIEQYKN